MDLLAHPARQGLDLWDQLVRMDRPALLAPLVPQAPLDHKVLLVGHKDPLAPLVLQALQARKACLEPQALLAFRDHRALPEFPAPLAPRVLLDRKAQPALLMGLLALYSLALRVMASLMILRRLMPPWRRTPASICQPGPIRLPALS